MNEPLHDRTRQRSAHTGRPAVLRVFGNAGLLAFASLCVISLISGNIGSALLWGGALLVFFAPALDQTAVSDLSRTGWLARQADALRWCGLALAAAGAALLLT
jgi:hypothetical protein